MASLSEVQSELKSASGQLERLLSEVTSDNRGDLNTEGVDGKDARSNSTLIAELTARVNELGRKRDGLRALDENRVEEEKSADESERKSFEAMKAGSPAAVESKAEVKSFEQMLAKAVQSAIERPKSEVEMSWDAKSFLEGKTVMSTGAGWAPESIRTPGSEELGRERRYISDIIPIVPTTQAAYVFMQQTTRTNNAAEAAESVQGTLTSAAESAFAYTEVTETLRKITHFVPATREQIEDVPGLLAELQAEMREGVLERLSSQLIVGTGTPPQIEGFLDAGRTGVNTHAKGTDDVLTAIKKGITVNESTGFAMVDTIVLHPNDWTAIQTLKTADGVFIFGNPAQATANRLWSHVVVESTHETENTALLGGFRRYSRIPARGNVTVELSNEHASFFIQDVWAIKASLRATLAVLRESAFTTVTGI